MALLSVSGSTAFSQRMRKGTENHMGGIYGKIQKKMQITSVYMAAYHGKEG